MRRRIMVGGIGLLAALVVLLVVLVAVIVAAIAGLFSPGTAEPAPSPADPESAQYGRGADPDFVGQSIDRALADAPSARLVRIVVSRDGVDVVTDGGGRATHHSYAPDRDPLTSEEDTAGADPVGLDRGGIDLQRLQSIWSDGRCGSDAPQVQVLGMVGGTAAYSLLCSANPDSADPGYALEGTWVGDQELALPDERSSAASLTGAVRDVLPSLTGDEPLSQLVVHEDRGDQGGASVEVDQQVQGASGPQLRTTVLAPRGSHSPGLSTTLTATDDATVPARFGWDQVDPGALAGIADDCRHDPALGDFRGVRVHWSDEWWQLAVTTDSDPTRSYALDGTPLG